MNEIALSVGESNMGRYSSNLKLSMGKKKKNKDIGKVSSTHKLKKNLSISQLFITITEFLR